MNIGNPLGNICHNSDPNLDSELHSSSRFFLGSLPEGPEKIKNYYHLCASIIRLSNYRGLGVEFQQTK